MFQRVEQYLSSTVGVEEPIPAHQMKKAFVFQKHTLKTQHLQLCEQLFIFCMIAILKNQIRILFLFIQSVIFLGKLHLLKYNILFKSNNKSLILFVLFLCCLFNLSTDSVVPLKLKTLCLLCIIKQTFLFFSKNDPQPNKNNFG